jgi:glycerol-1-phosphate dehydrogenase [NAD(P)+]
MKDVDRILEDLLDSSFDCECGRSHRVPTLVVDVAPGAFERAPATIAGLVDGNRMLIVADTNTWTAAGEVFDRAVTGDYATARCIVPEPANDHVHASVELVDELAASFGDVFDVYAAVGSGTINDLTKELAHRRGRPYVAVASAASMNGYTSSIVALLAKGLKTTGPATPPLAVMGEPDILVDAPLELTLAGLGDLVSKPYCGCDWWIASLVRGEAYCPVPGRILEDAFATGLEVFPGLRDRDPGAVALLAKLLIISGMTMTIAGTSSPASGGEHLLSHYWDMVYLRDGRPLHLHGAQVGVASMVMDALYGAVLDTDFRAATAIPSPNLEDARRDLEGVFGDLTPAVWPQWSAKLAERNDTDLELLRTNEGKIKEEIRRVLETGRSVRRALEGSGAPMWAHQLGITDDELTAAIRHGRKIRTRYTILDVAAELGVLDGFADSYCRHGYPA